MNDRFCLCIAVVAVLVGCEGKGSTGTSSPKEAPAKLGIQSAVVLEECRGEFDGHGVAFKLKSGWRLYFNKSCATPPGCDVWSESKNEEQCPKGALLSFEVPNNSAGAYQATETRFSGIEKRSSEFVKDFSVSITGSSESEISGSVKSNMPDKKIEGAFVAKVCTTPEDLLR